jgi:hypothetical protein
MEISYPSYTYTGSLHFHFPTLIADAMFIAWGSGLEPPGTKDNPNAPLNPELVRILKAALSKGFTHIDTADTYGTESEVGIAIKKRSIPAREALHHQGPGRMARRTRRHAEEP